MWCEVFRRVACVHIYYHFSLEHFEIGQLKHTPAHFHSTVTFHSKMHFSWLTQLLLLDHFNFVPLNRTLILKYHPHLLYQFD